MKFVKKPLVIEAWHNVDDEEPVPFWVDEAAERMSGGRFRIKTLEGEMVASLGDWIIKGIKGELYPCRADIFEATYDRVAG